MSASIGQPVPRLEDQALLTGKGRYVDDIASPGALHAAFVRSPHAHALIRRIDADGARAIPGVHAVFAIDDLAPALTRRRMSRVSNSGSKLDQSWPFVLADGEASYVGEPLAIVVADSRYIAEDAAAAVEVDYEVLPAAADCRDAAQKGAAPVRRELAANQIMSYRVNYGEVDAAFTKSAHVFRDELWIHRGGSHSIEGRGILAEYSDRGIEIWASTQKAHDMFHMLADMLDLNENRLRVATPDVGGGFGPKLCTYPEDVSVVAAAKLLRRSVKWVEDRREHFTNAVHERDQYWTMEIAVDADARVLGIRGGILHDVGAYAMQDVNLPYNSATSVSGTYMVAALQMDVIVTHTNKTPVSSVRGAGYPQAAFAIERMLDLVAREMKLDRAEVRRRNLIPTEKMPYKKPLKARSGEPIQYDSGDYPGCQAEVLKAAGWDEFARRQQAARAEGRYVGIGLAHGLKGTGRGPFEFGGVRVSPTGRISVLTGAAAMGQGLATALAQICAEQFGVRAQDITVVSGDSSATSLGLGGFASRQTVTAGSSVHIAAKAVTAKARKLASHLLEAAEDDLEIADGEVRVVGAPQLSVKLAELSRILKGAPGYGFPPGVEPGLEANATFRTDALAYSNGCHVVEVEVDIETGGVHIVRYIAIQDSGRRVNPLIVEGQVHGGICHGIGNAMFEWMGYDAGAQPITTTFADYLLTTATELPRFETLYKESPSPNNPLGVKGVGEVGVIPAAAAVISAIEDALKPFDVRISQMPVPPHKLMELIAQGRDRMPASRPLEGVLPSRE